MPPFSPISRYANFVPSTSIDLVDALSKVNFICVLLILAKELDFHGKLAAVGQITCPEYSISLHNGTTKAEIAHVEKLISRAISTQNGKPHPGANISFFRFYRNHAMLRASRLTGRGERAVVTIREAGMRWPCRVAA